MRRSFSGILAVSSITLIAACTTLPSDAPSIASPPIESDAPAELYLTINFDGPTIEACFFLRSVSPDLIVMRKGVAPVGPGSQTRLIKAEAISDVDLIYDHQFIPSPPERITDYQTLSRRDFTTSCVKHRSDDQSGRLVVYGQFRSIIPRSLKDVPEHWKKVSEGRSVRVLVAEDRPIRSATCTIDYDRQRTSCEALRPPSN